MVVVERIGVNSELEGRLERGGGAENAVSRGGVLFFSGRGFFCEGSIVERGIYVAMCLIACWLGAGGGVVLYCICGG